MYFSMIDDTENYNYLLCKDNVFTMDLWWSKDNYFQYYIVIFNSCFVFVCTFVGSLTLMRFFLK